jgi:hypothetical protein
MLANFPVGSPQHTILPAPWVQRVYQPGRFLSPNFVKASFILTLFWLAAVASMIVAVKYINATTTLMRKIPCQRNDLNFSCTKR